MDEARLSDRRLVRRSFERAAAGYDAAAVLQKEIGRRMLDRLDFIRHVPRSILDAGSGTGGALAPLRKRYPGAALYALDVALAMLTQLQTPLWLRALGRRRARAVCADLEQLPLRDATFGMVWSNLVLQWIKEPSRAFAEVFRILEPGGLFMFSTFGPDTLKELREAFRGTDRYAHVNRFVDMHDLGDMLLHSGFADPVMDMEYLTLTYTDVRALMRDLKAIGAQTVTADRRPGMTSRSTLRTVERNYEAWRRDGRLPATFEVVYGHAWKPQSRRTPEGRPIIDIKVQKGS
jgi:malonyl-CoA O-methyltransferase